MRMSNALDTVKLVVVVAPSPARKWDGYDVRVVRLSLGHGRSQIYSGGGGGGGGGEKIGKGEGWKVRRGWGMGEGDSDVDIMWKEMIANR